MRRAESVFALAVAVLCLGYLYFVWQMEDFGSVTEPGAAFVPGVIGVLVLAISVKILITSLLRADGGKAEKIPKAGLLRFIGYVVASLVFIPVFEILGAYIAIFALVLILTKILGSKGWIEPLGLAVASSVIAYVLFFTLLDVPLPRGIF
jgi:putative tricarboxylic transport membrane protein